MQKRLPGRVLARVLAVDLRSVRGADDVEVATCGVTDPSPVTGRRDITNGPTDFDVPPSF